MVAIEGEPIGRDCGPADFDALLLKLKGAARPLKLPFVRAGSMSQDPRDATIYGLGTRRRAVDYWSYVGVTPDRDGVEWSPGRCKVFSTTGLPAFPVDAPGSHNDYSKYAESFPSEAMAEATVDANYAKQFL